MIGAAVMTLAYLLEAMGALVTNTFGTSVHSSLHLFANNFVPQPGSVPADFTEATFDGYAALNITAWGTVHLLPSNQPAVAPTTTIAFTPTGSLTPNTIYGYYIKDPAGNIIIAERFPSPVVLNGTGTTLQFVPEVAIAAGNTTAVIVP